MNGKDTEIVRGKTPDSKSTADGRNTGISAFEHSVRGQRIPLLASSLLFHIGDPRSDVVLVSGITVALAELEFLLELLTLVVQPLGDLLAAEGQLARAVSKVEDRERVLRLKLTTDRQRAATRSGDGSPSLVTEDGRQYPSNMR